jgi:hypothetical protein
VLLLTTRQLYIRRTEHGSATDSVAWIVRCIESMAWARAVHLAAELPSRRLLSAYQVICRCTHAAHMLCVVSNVDSIQVHALKLQQSPCQALYITHFHRCHALHTFRGLKSQDPVPNAQYSKFWETDSANVRVYSTMVLIVADVKTVASRGRGSLRGASSPPDHLQSRLVVPNPAH